LYAVATKTVSDRTKEEEKPRKRKKHTPLSRPKGGKKKPKTTGWRSFISTGKVLTLVRPP